MNREWQRERLGSAKTNGEADDRKSNKCRNLRVWHRRDGYWEAMIRFREELNRVACTRNDADQANPDSPPKLMWPIPAVCGRRHQISSCRLCRLRSGCNLTRQ